MTSENAYLYDLSDQDLLASALCEAMDARRDGELGGPGVDEVALRRAEQRARRADARRARAAALGGAA